MIHLNIYLYRTNYIRRKRIEIEKNYKCFEIKFYFSRYRLGFSPTTWRLSNKLQKDYMQFMIYNSGYRQIEIGPFWIIKQYF